jgi:hypothetical protein
VADFVDSPLVVHRARIGAGVLGSVGLVAGYFGPVILAPDAAQGPLLGLFFTGPFGAVVGAGLGVGCALLRLKRSLFALAVSTAALLLAAGVLWSIRS